MKLYSLFSPFFYNKVLQVGLWLVWLCGFIFITISFYATTQMLPTSPAHQMKTVKFFYHGFPDGGGPTITIFTAPEPFSGLVGTRQASAIKSWLGLSSDITVVLFSQHPSVFSFSAALGFRVSVEPDIDFTFLGIPFFHSMVARSQASTSDISVFVDPNVIILPDLITTLDHVWKLDHDWLLVASSQNVSHFPFHMDLDGKHWLTDDGKQITTEKLQAFLAQRWQLRQCEDKLLMAWNNGDLPLHTGVLPPFLYGKGIHNRWIVHEALLSEFRFVFDASSTISSFYLNNLDHVPYTKSWENEGNSHLGAVYGSLYFREADYSNMAKLYKCDGRYIFVDTVEEIVYRSEYQRALSISRDKKIIQCIDAIRSVYNTKDCFVKDQLKSSLSISFPYSLESLLAVRANKNETIVLAFAGYSYKDMLMSWVCRLRHLKMTNFLFCALDDEMYNFSVLQGLPVFRDSFAPTNISFDDCHFGTTCFQRVTKVKSRVVLQILKLGYSVLLSDVDIYWFKNPLPLLNSFGPAVLVAQSDEYNTTGPINMPRRLNSGFYYANSDVSTIAGLERVVKHAATSNLSEQPSFYDTLCGEGGSYCVSDNRCFEPETNLTVHFLDRELFPNGAYRGLWEERDVKAACLRIGCVILHNNWISGRRKKLERQVISGLWEYDSSTRMCLQSWQKTKSTSYF